MGEPLAAALRSLPAVDRVAASLSGPPTLVTAAARAAIDSARRAVRAGGEAPTLDEVVAAARASLAERERGLLRPVINATGVLIHTNLGRVPLGQRQLDAVVRVAGGYSNLELDLATGRRGSRYSHAAGLIDALVGSEASLVVNNNAAAVLLVLASLCGGREVIISRGELVEIGGEFRIPDVMTAAGTRLVEVGTTNRTHLVDYERAINADTAAILKVHPSNYQVVGFTKTVAPRDVSRLARGRGVCFIHDLGSGLMSGAPAMDGGEDEPVAGLALSEGADIVTFSGDKLLGGPQAGVIAGRADLVAQISKHPLLRALRVDKMTLAALEATLSAYLEGAAAELPFWAMANASWESLEARARDLTARLVESCRDAKVEVAALTGVTGGGSRPGRELASWGLAITHPERSTAEVERALRSGEVPVIARIEDDRLLLDLRSVPPAHDAQLEQLLTAALTH